MHKTLTSVVALAGLAAAGAAQAEDAVIAGDSVEPMELSPSQMDEVTAAGGGDRVCVVCAKAVVNQALAYAINIYGFEADRGEWFADLRSWFGGPSKGSGEVTRTHSSTAQETDPSESSRHQVIRVSQEKSSTATATEGGSAVARDSNVTAIEQKN
jgi:hypothetical protein